MKLLQNATVAFADPYLDHDSYDRARIVMNGSVVSITVPGEPGRPGNRIDRIFAATWQEKKGKAKEVVISGRSEYLTNMGAESEDRQVTITATGGVCETC